MKKRTWLRFMPLLVLLGGGVALWPYRHALTAEAISHYSPRTAVWAALFLLALYAVKSLSVCFPLAALEAAGGLLFPYPIALGVNLAGWPWSTPSPFCWGSEAGRDWTRWWKSTPVWRFCKRFAETAMGCLFFYCGWRAPHRGIWSVCIWGRRGFPLPFICPPDWREAFPAWQPPRF